jgi:hypothetical protein
MPPKQTIINIDDDKLKSILEKVESRLPTKPKEGMTLREIILKSKAMINKALKRGYTYDEIAAILSEEGISVKGTTLKQYLADSTKSQRRKPEPDHPSDQTATVEPPLKLLTLLPSHQPNHRLLKRIKQDTETDTKVDTKRKSVVRGKFANIPKNEEL